MKNAVFWDVTPCDFYEKRRFGGMQAVKKYNVHIVFFSQRASVASYC
jgi:hypothetical protein